MHSLTYFSAVLATCISITYAAPTLQGLNDLLEVRQIPNANLYPDGESSRTCPAVNPQLVLGPLDGSNGPLSKRALSSEAPQTPAPNYFKRDVGCALLSSTNVAGFPLPVANSKTVLLFQGVTYILKAQFDHNLNGVTAWYSAGTKWVESWEMGATSANIVLERTFTLAHNTYLHFEMDFDGVDANSLVNGVLELFVKD